jgi:TfoX/Sxy family transcriptional regulator of competence genes
MAWVKIPAEHHPIFMAAVPKDPRVTTLKMFGGIAAKANGQMFAGLFAKSFVVKLSEADREEALQLDGATIFDPMGNGRVMKDTVHMPEETFGDDAELRAWLRRGLDYTLALPAKGDKKPAAKAAKPVANPVKKSTPKKPAAKPKTAKSRKKSR